MSCTSESKLAARVSAPAAEEIAPLPAAEEESMMPGGPLRFLPEPTLAVAESFALSREREREEGRVDVDVASDVVVEEDDALPLYDDELLKTSEEDEGAVSAKLITCGDEVA